MEWDLPVKEAFQILHPLVVGWDLPATALAHPLLPTQALVHSPRRRLAAAGWDLRIKALAHLLLLWVNQRALNPPETQSRTSSMAYLENPNPKTIIMEDNNNNEAFLLLPLAAPPRNRTK